MSNITITIKDQSERIDIEFERWVDCATALCGLAILATGRRNVSEMVEVMEQVAGRVERVERGEDVG